MCKRQKYLKIEFSKSWHFYSNHGAQIFVGRHRLPVAHSDIQVQLWVGHCPSCGIFSSAGLAETLYLGRGQCSCFNGKFLQLSYSIQVLLVTAVAGVIRLIVCSFIFLSVWRSSNMLFVAYQHFSNQTMIQPDPRLLCFSSPLQLYIGSFSFSSRTMLPPVHPQWPEYYLCIEPWSLDLS